MRNALEVGGRYSHGKFFLEIERNLNHRLYFFFGEVFQIDKVPPAKD